MVINSKSPIPTPRPQTHQEGISGRNAASNRYPDIRTLNLPAVSTEQAAYYLLRMPQTLRLWACRENGPIRPIRINGRLAWQVSDIRKVLGI